MTPAIRAGAKYDFGSPELAIGAVPTLSEILANGQLNSMEAAELIESETVIGKGLKTFIEVGARLVSIRDKRLYRYKYSTFEDYCEKRWGMTGRRARQLSDASRVIENLGTFVPKPKTESQARPLTALPAADQRPAWEEAREVAKPDEPTAKQVKAVVDRRMGKQMPVIEAPEVKKWPKPNAHGVFDEDLAEKLEFTHAALWVEILILQIREHCWTYAKAYSYKTGHCSSQSEPLTADRLFNSRGEALEDAVRETVKRQKAYAEGKGSENLNDQQRAAARRAIDWANGLLQEPDSPEPRKSSAADQPQYEANAAMKGLANEAYRILKRLDGMGIRGQAARCLENAITSLKEFFEELGRIAKSQIANGAAKDVKHTWIVYNSPTKKAPEPAAKKSKTRASSSRIYVISRRAVDAKRTFYLTKEGGWTPDKIRADRFGSHHEAHLRLGRRSGQVKLWEAPK